MSSKRVILAVDNNQGYAADQIDTHLTLGDLLSMIEEAITFHGEDAVVVTRDTGNRYGANWGRLDYNTDITAVGEDDDADDADEF